MTQGPADRIAARGCRTAIPVRDRPAGGLAR